MDLNINTPQGQCFNIRTAAILRSEDGRILVHRSLKEAFYTLVGGRCKVGETTLRALQRELKEELNRSDGMKTLASP